MSRGSLDVVGEHYYQGALRSIAGPKCEDGYDMPVQVELRREPNNPHDANAVLCLINGRPVGHINRQDAPRLQELLRNCERNGKKAYVDGRIVGGWKDGNDEDDYEVKID
jgi:hypothetical protein